MALYEVRTMSGTLMMVLREASVSLAAAVADRVAKLHGICDDRIVRTADLARLPSEASTAARDVGEWVNPACLPAAVA